MSGPGPAAVNEDVPLGAAQVNEHTLDACSHSLFAGSANPVDPDRASMLGHHLLKRTDLALEAIGIVVKQIGLDQRGLPRLLKR